ncbi:glutaminyl-peptide cyclotransferase-like [Ctenocephalides felis]|uniref:glutaminyl-peptide cyclotransferase-like n=1 Tax=Ctenocephalides felis TaxID=7515 RepID=UPI000E6E2A05|nr:glutaminyl-peptide cyclotransferase-like [Ctenocephalides felis]
MFNSLLFNVCCTILLSKTYSCARLYEERRLHNAYDLSDSEIEQISNLSDMPKFENTLDQILIPRVVGTPNHTKVKRYIISELKRLGVSVETDKFQQEAPGFGKLVFENIIGRVNPNATRYVVLACHYDSKYFPDDEFFGATDSAVPCAMMLNLVEILKPYFKEDNNVSLKLIFFDGEEAFQEWGPRDSIYGAKHLAAKWHSTPYPKNNRENNSELDRIDVLILLDLLGSANPKFYSYFKETERWYLRFMRLEERLGNLGLLHSCAHCRKPTPYFQPRSRNGGIEDDHIPFLQRDVPILHLIPTPFPPVWHTPADDKTALDMNTIENLNKLLRLFIAEYLHLSPH